MQHHVSAIGIKPIMVSVLDEQAIHLDRMKRSSVRLAHPTLTDIMGHSLTRLRKMVYGVLSLTPI